VKKKTLKKRFASSSQVSPAKLSRLGTLEALRVGTKIRIGIFHHRGGGEQGVGMDVEELACMHGC
jgi:hypothetical protein